MSLRGFVVAKVLGVTVTSSFFAVFADVLWSSKQIESIRYDFEPNIAILAVLFTAISLLSLLGGYTGVILYRILFDKNMIEVQELKLNTN